MSSSSRFAAIDRWLRRALLGLVVLSSAVAAPAAPPPEAADLGSPRLVGEGRMSFLGLDVYEARLWAAAGFDPSRYEAGAMALELRYARALRGHSIAERSLQEMRRAGPLDEALATAWLGLMQRAFPDVRAGERLTGVLQAGRVSFFHDGRLTASVEDRQFAARFFGIWLAQWSSEPALRRALLGER